MLSKPKRHSGLVVLNPGASHRDLRSCILRPHIRAHVLKARQALCLSAAVLAAVVFRVDVFVARRLGIPVELRLWVRIALVSADSEASSMSCVSHELFHRAAPSPPPHRQEMPFCPKALLLYPTPLP